MGVDDAEHRFDDWNIHTTTYKEVGDHGIEVNVIIPKDIKPGSHPLIVRFHGGFLVRHPEQLQPSRFIVS